MDSSENVQGNFAAINGAELYFDTTGVGDAVLFIHAGVADSRMWEAQVDEFSNTHFVIRCDLRGFGRSRMPAGTFAYHDDIAGLLTYLDIEQATIIGASFGGAVALDFALAYPDMINTLVLVSPALGGYEFTSPDVLEFFAAEADALERNDVATATELNLTMWVDGPDRSAADVSSDVREQVSDMQMHIFSQPDVENAEETELRPPAIDQLPDIDVPTLVISGAKDVPEFQEISQLISSRIPNAELIVMPDVAHLPSMETPATFNRSVREFLAQN